MCEIETRRKFLGMSALIGVNALVGGCGPGERPETRGQAIRPKPSGPEKGGEVTATEDLMREHGVLRRALLVYSAAAARLRENPTSISAEALQKTARLFRAFGEEYHEKMLEEAYIIPAVKRAGGSAATYTDILLAQHQRGREITDHIIDVTQGQKLSTHNVEAFARSLDAFALMYRHHAAREDTIVFPAWKQTLTAQQLDEIGDKFEEIELRQFGADGFETAVRQVSDIEASLGLADLAQFTAPRPRV